MTILIGDVQAPAASNNRVATQAAALTLSGLNFMMKTADPVTGYRIRTLGEGFKVGDPEAVIASIVSQLQDGDLERIDRNGNREATIPLVIDAPGSGTPGAVIAAAEAALDAACRFDGWTEMIYTSPLAGAEPTVFEVTSATWAMDVDDITEMKRGKRYPTLTIHARPFVRGTTPVTIDAPPVTGSTTTTVDDGSSATGWSVLSTRPDAVTNAETNPDFAVNTTGYTPGAGASHVYYWANGSVTGANVVSSQMLAAGSYSALNGPLLPAAPGVTYQVGSVASTAGTDSMGCIVRFYSDLAGTKQLGADRQFSAAGGQSATRSWAVTAPSGAATMRVFRLVTTRAPTNDLSWVLDKQWTIPLTENGLGLGYFDGATADTSAITYSWSGAANNSASVATWTAPALGVVSGAVRGTIYGRPAVTIRRAAAIDMTELPYLRIRGTATAVPDGRVIVNDNSTVNDVDPTGFSALTTASYSYNATTGVFEIIVHRPGGFTSLDVTFLRENQAQAASTTGGLFVSVDSVEITDNPFGTGFVQSRQVQIYGSQRTELSLEVLGVADDGTSPTGLGEEVLVHTAAAGSDGRAKFLSVRTASGVGGTSDETATGGYYTALDTTASPAAFTFPAPTLLPGNYLAVARLRATAAFASATLSHRAHVTTTGGQTAYDPRTGWRTAPLVAVDAGSAAWPQLLVGGWALVPIGMLRLPPADIEDPSATVTIEVGSDTSGVQLDDIFLCNADVGQASLLLTSTGDGTSFSAVRLDAATVDAPQASAWVGDIDGVMMADAARWIGEQHQAAPGLLQIGTVTPGCKTSRVSGHYYDRNHTNYSSADQVTS